MNVLTLWKERKKFPSIKKKAFAFLACALFLTHPWANLEADRVLDVDVGYPFPEDPVPLDPGCILPQMIPGSSTTIFYGADVEPTIAVNPKKPNFIVAAWQNDRIDNGGALELPVAHSCDGGRTWSRSVVPFQACIGGITHRISDPWLSYSIDGETVYFSALIFNTVFDPNTPTQEGVAVAVSKDNGVTWKTHILITSPATFVENLEFPIDDKPSVTADPNHNNVAYVVWDRFPFGIASLHSVSTFAKTSNGGKKWSTAYTIYDPFPDLNAHNLSNGNINDNNTISNTIVVQPLRKPKFNPRTRGDLLDFMVRVYAIPGATDAEYSSDFVFPFMFTTADIVFVRSQDLGLTWDTFATVVAPFDVNAVVFTGGYTYGPGGIVTGGVGTQLRTNIGPLGQVMAPAVNPCNGNLYVVFQTGQFRADKLPQIGLVSSRDGGRTWSPPIQVNLTPPFAANPQAFTPSVAVTEDGFVGIVYYDFRNDPKTNPDATLTDAWIDIYREVHDPNGGSTGVGLDFVREVRLSKQSFIQQSGPVTGQGVMTSGDYTSVVAQCNKFYAIYIKSFPGPFTPPFPFFSDPGTGTSIFIDLNKRTDPFVSIVNARR